MEGLLDRLPHQVADRVEERAVVTERVVFGEGVLRRAGHVRVIVATRTANESDPCNFVEPSAEPREAAPSRRVVLRFAEPAAAGC